MQKTISFRLLNGFLESELNIIQQAYEQSAITANHQKAGRAIAWVCYMFSDQLSDPFTNTLISFVEDLLDAEDEEWVHLPSVLAASYILKENRTTCDRLLPQVAHGTSGIRNNIIKAVGFMAPQLSFANRRLKDAVKTNIERSQFLYREATVLLLSTKASNEEKRRWALQMKKEYDEFEDHRAFFNEIFEEAEYHSNSFFADTFSAAKSYLIFKLLSAPTPSDHQSSLFTSFSDSQALMQHLQKREQAHPLSQSYIDLSCLKEKKTGLFKEE